MGHANVVTMTAKEKIEVIQAREGGEVVERRYILWNLNGTPRTSAWRRMDFDGDFNFQDYDYRVKSVPREVWVNVYNGGQWYAYCSLESAQRDLVSGGITKHFVEVV